MTPLKTRPCTYADIDWDGTDENAQFYKPANGFSRDVNTYWNTLQCIDDPIALVGNFNTAVATQLLITFEVCRDPVGTPIPKCKDYETVIKPWMRQKYLFTLENSAVF